MNQKERNIPTPFVSGNISLEAKGKDFSDIWITCSGWANDEQRFRYNLKKDAFKSKEFKKNIVNMIRENIPNE